MDVFTCVDNDNVDDTSTVKVKVKGPLGDDPNGQSHEGTTCCRCEVDGDEGDDDDNINTVKR